MAIFADARDMRKYGLPLKKFLKPLKMKSVNKMKVVNKSLRKIDSTALSQGKHMYTGDLTPPNALM